MNDKKLYIPQDALAQTKQICREELSIICAQHNRSTFALLLRFLKIDLSLYIRISILAFLAMLGVYVISSQSGTIPLSIYFFILGCMNVYESYKNEVYHTTELFTPVYLHQGRVFLYKNATIAILQCLMFAIVLLIHGSLPSLSFVNIFMSSFLPLWIAQVIILQFIHYIHHLYFAFVLYVGIFILYLALYYRFETLFLTYMNDALALFIFITLGCIFIITLFIKSKHKEEGIYGINLNTY